MNVLPTHSIHGRPKSRLAAFARRRGTALVVGGLLAVASAVATPAADEASPPTTRPASGPASTSSDPSMAVWANHVKPIFEKSCVSCHGGAKQKGGLDLRDPAAILAGGTDGSVVIPGRPGESPLYQRLLANAEGHMPPEKEKEPQLPAEEVAFIREWIASMPTPGDRSSTAIAAAGRDGGQTTPSLVELAAAAKWGLPPGTEGSAAIDHLIQARWREQGVSGSDVCDDRTFVRRVYLDLAGRIPTRDEADAFISSGEANKRVALVDRLLAGADYPRHMAEVFDVVLMERKGKGADAGRRSSGWIEYLRSSFAADRPWDRMVADLIVARPQSPEQRGASWFLYERKNNAPAMAEAVAPVAFGVSVACAQCHGHPLAKEIKQQHYWGLVAAFNRSANVDGPGGPAVSESAVGGFVNFTNLKKESQPATLSFPNDRMVAEVRPADGAKEPSDADVNYVVPPSKDKGKSGRPAVPVFSRRQALADAATHDNPLLACAFVNRVWAMLVGRGFVNPVDQMDSRHPPSHPELLAWLSADFERSGYDVKRLLRTIVLSRTYQLDSRWTGPTPPPVAELFARGLEKPLPAEVLYRSLQVATGRGPATDNDAGDADPLRQALVTAFPGLFEPEYNATLAQAMFLTNSPLFDALVRPAAGNLTDRLLKLSTNDERVTTAFAEALGRPPDDAESAAAVAFLNARADRPETGVRQFTWALLTGAEFLMNH